MICNQKWREKQAHHLLPVNYLKLINNMSFTLHKRNFYKKLKYTRLKLPIFTKRKLTKCSLYIV